jgi:hypothetical protein
MCAKSKQLKALPILHTPYKDNDEPNLTIDLTLNPLPSETKSATLINELNLATPKTLKDEAILVYDLILIDDPTMTKSRRESEEPHLVKPYTLKLDPNLAAERQDKLEPMCKKFKMEHAAPARIFGPKTETDEPIRQ